MRKKLIISLVTLLFSTSIFAQNKNAKVTFFQGKAYILEYRKGYKKQSIRINTIIKPNDIIVTGKNGKVKIKLADNSKVTVKENSKIKFSLVSRKMQRIQVRKGGVLSNVNKLFGSKGYMIETPIGVAGVRGTEFVVEYESDKDKSYVEVNSGKVLVSQHKMKKEPFAIIKDGKIRYGEEVKVERKYTNLQKEQGVSFDNKELELIKRKKDHKRVILYGHIDAWELN